VVGQTVPSAGSSNKEGPVADGAHSGHQIGLCIVPHVTPKYRSLRETTASYKPPIFGNIAFTVVINTRIKYSADDAVNGILHL